MDSLQFTWFVIVCPSENENENDTYVVHRLSLWYNQCLRSQSLCLGELKSLCTLVSNLNVVDVNPSLNIFKIYSWFSPLISRFTCDVWGLMELFSCVSVNRPSLRDELNSFLLLNCVTAACWGTSAAQLPTCKHLHTHTHIHTYLCYLAYFLISWFWNLYVIHQRKKKQ